MREPPLGLSVEALQESLRGSYGLDVTDIVFLPLGYDSSAWVYRVEVKGGGCYFLKARKGATSEAGLLVPRFLHAMGLSGIVAPLTAKTGTLSTEASRFRLVLYPFIEGVAANEVRMTEEQWAAYGALLRRVHDTALPAELAAVTPREAFIPAGTHLVPRLDAHIGSQGFDEPAAATLAAFWQAHREQIQAVHAATGELAQGLAGSSRPHVLCHADIHTANVIVDGEGRVWFVDWDSVILSPRERDLMFVIGGINSRSVTPREEELFFQGYGEADVDRVALAYYRHAWALGDIADFAAQVFFRPDLGPETKAAAAELFMSLFQPGEIVEMALKSR